MRTYLGDISVLGCVGFRSKELKNPEYKNYRYGYRLSDIRLRTYLGLISVLDRVSLDPRPQKTGSDWIRDLQERLSNIRLNANMFRLDVGARVCIARYGYTADHPGQISPRKGR